MHRHVCARNLGHYLKNLQKTADLGLDGERAMPQFKRRLAGFDLAAALATVLCVAAQTAKADNLGNDPCGVTFTVSHPDAIGRPGAYVTQLVYTPPPGFQFTKKDLVKGPSAPKYSWSIDGNGNLVLSMPAPPNQFPQSSTSSSSFQFQKGISSNTGSCNYTTGDLQGMLVRTSLSDGYITTSRFASDGLNVMGGTGTPASDIPATIDPNKFTQLAGAKPCSPGTEMSSDQKLTNGCPDPAKVGAADGDPAKERQPGAIASCTPSGSLSALIQTSPSPATVTAYVPKGTWGPSNTGVRVVSIEPAGGTPAFISTPNPVNSCASNSMTGQTVCVANNTDVYLLSGTTMAPALTSGATGNASFSGGSCQNCGVAINQVTNTAAITMSLLNSPSGTGIQFLNLGTNTFSPPLAAANQVSEGIQWDPSRKLMQLSNEQGVIL